MRVTKRIHHIWNRQTGIPEQSGGRSPLVGKYQYVYESDDGKRQISLVELPDYFGDGVMLWEICSLGGDLFDDIERFNSKDEAEKRIRECLDSPPTNQ